MKYGDTAFVRRPNGDLFAGRFVGWRPNNTATVRTDTDAASGPLVADARCCEGCETPFVPEPFGDPEFCALCTEADELDNLEPVAVPLGSLEQLRNAVNAALADLTVSGRGCCEDGSDLPSVTALDGALSLLDRLTGRAS